MAAASHFFGADGVLNAYTTRGLDVWGLFHGKNLMTAGDTAEDLSQFLEMLQQGAGNTVFTLKVYKDVDDPESITDKTPANGSFNFMLNGGMYNAPGRVSGYDQINARLDQLEKKISGAGDSEGRKSIGDILYDHLENPEKLASLVGTILTVLRPPAPAYAMGRYSSPVAPADQVANISQNNQSSMTSYNETDAERLAAAIDQLEKADPKILDHLEKLAQLSSTNKQLFTMLIRQLDSM